MTANADPRLCTCGHEAQMHDDDNDPIFLDPFARLLACRKCDCREFTDSGADNYKRIPWKKPERASHLPVKGKS